MNLLLIAAIQGLAIFYPVTTETTRNYYIAAVEVLWNYAPNVDENISNEYTPFIEKYLLESNLPPRIGRSYWKAVLREYTDNTFQTLVQRPEWMGIIGPVIQAEVGDIIKVHFYNNANFPFSLHPHGFAYNKSNEGAYAQDNTTEDEKRDDAVQPGDKFTYIWRLPEYNSPTSSDPDCLTMAYHSHYHTNSDLQSGLIGPLLICKRGILSEEKRIADHTIFLLFITFDENESWYIDRTITEKFPSLTAFEVDLLRQDEEFIDSNFMHSINGLTFQSLKGLDFCIGDQIEWRLIGMGKEIDFHSITFLNNLVTMNGHKTDVINLVPAKFITSFMTIRHTGTWKIISETGYQFLAGMEAAFTARECNATEPELNSFTIPTNPRTYYIAIEEIFWNYAPSGINMFTNENLTLDENAAVFFEIKPNRIGGTYKKAVYREYLDENFENQMQCNHENQHLGFLGPILRIEVNETIKLIVKNKANQSYSIYSSGVEIYNENGILINNETVSPQSTAVFYWHVPEYYAPSINDPQCLTWRYHSNVNFIQDTYSGLNGVLLTCRKGILNENGKQKNVDKEYALLFTVMDENESHYIKENIRTFCSDPDDVDISDEGFQESNTMHAINGLMYGNLKGLCMNYNDTVSWHIITTNKETDLHSAYFHGETFLQYGVYKDTVALLPSSHYSIIMIANNPGEWNLECRTVDHYLAGMRAKYEIRRPNQIEDIQIEGKTVRTYYLAAVEKEWNYATHNQHVITGEILTEYEESKVFVERGDHTIGRIYKKVIYEQYLDSEFSQIVPKASHLGLLGPMIKAEIGDIIRIVFKNMANEHSYSIHMHGIKAISETIPTLPNTTQTYLWEVQEKSGPENSEFNCTAWIYYSDADIVKDINSGLIGPLTVCNKGTLEETGKRKDVKDEFALLFMIFDENLSWYLEENIQTYCFKSEEVDPEDNYFKESNLKHAINGKIYGSLEGLQARVRDHLAWYLIGLGNEADMHTAHFHGVTYVHWKNGKHREDVTELLPGTFETVEMIPEIPGKFLIHCHVQDHMNDGMVTLFNVID